MIIKNFGSKSKWLLVPVAVLCLAWVQPELPLSSGKVQSDIPLDYVTFEVGDKTTHVKNGEIFRVVATDKFKIIDAMLSAASQRPLQVNLVGFSHKNGAEDRNVEVRAGRDFIKKWSEAGNGKTYAVVVSSGKEIHGGVFVEVIDPKLKYLELLVSGARKIIRDGEPIMMFEDQEFKVLDIQANFDDAQTSRVEITPVTSKEAVSKMYEMRLSKEGLVYAQIPLILSKRM